MPEPPRLRFAILGPVDISGTAETDRLLAQPKLLALLMYLVLAPGRGYVNRERIIGMFWPDQPEERARSSLRTALYLIRDAVGEDILLRRGGDIAANPERFRCDAYEFTAALQRDELAGALELYRGPVLEGLYPETAELQHWLDQEREAYQSAAAEAAWTLAERYESAASDLTSAARWARRAAKLARTDERRIRRVMQLLARAGDSAGAIGVFEEFSRYLARELDVEPSDETRELARAIRERRAAS